MNLSEFADCFRMDNAEIVVLDEHVAKAGEYSDFFFSYCVLNGELNSLNVSYPSIPYYLLHTPEFLDKQEKYCERLYLNRYAQTAFGFARTERIQLGGGEDPRVVSNGKRAYAVIIAANHLYEYEMLLYDLVENRLVPLTVDVPNFEYGKNWQPFMIGDELYCVHQLTPFRVLRIDTDTGVAGIVSEMDVAFNMPCAHSQFGSSFPAFRGGSNAIEIEGKIFGVGRASSVSVRHAPFFWSKNGDNIDIVFTSFFTEFYNRGYNIIDPTSLFIEDGDVYLGLCCTERDWAHTQLVSNFLIVFRREVLQGGSASLANYFERRNLTQVKGSPNLDRHMFLCLEMPCAIESEIEYSGRVSVGTPGYLVDGPYVEIEKEGRYCAELSYLTKSVLPKRAGVFELVADRQEDGYYSLGSVDLRSTDGWIEHVRVEFDTTGLCGLSLETRVFVEQDVQLVAFHIRTWNVSSADDSKSLFPWSPLAFTR